MVQRSKKPKKRIVVSRPLSPRKPRRIGKIQNHAIARRSNKSGSINWYAWGYQAGLRDAKVKSIENSAYQKKALNEFWLQAYRQAPFSKSDWNAYNQASSGYVLGYFNGAGIHPQPWVMLPTLKSVAVVVTAMNEEDTIGEVLSQLHRLPFDEIVVVVNGSGDSTFQKARGKSHAIIVHYPDALGHDVGRAVGAKLTNSEILLFLDGDFVVKAEDLISFIGKVDQGTDIALNDLTPYMGTFQTWDSVSMLKYFLNKVQQRGDLSVNSLTAVPHAISRKAYNIIGPSCLAVPPKAHAIAISKGLVVRTAASINVLSANKIKEHNRGQMNEVADLIVGDHVEAVKHLMKGSKDRLNFPDVMRLREWAK